jgi:hypothetical protein
MRFDRIGTIGLVLPLGLLWLAGAPVYAAESHNAIRVSDAWIRWLPVNAPSGGFMSLTNGNHESLVLDGVTSPAFADGSIHQTTEMNGASRMAPVKAVTIAPSSTVRFQPGGYHLMLMQPRRQLQPGDHVPITLRFANGQSLEVLFEVRDAAGNPAGKAHAMDDMPMDHH